MAFTKSRLPGGFFHYMQNAILWLAYVLVRQHENQPMSLRGAGGPPEESGNPPSIPFAAPNGIIGWATDHQNMARHP